MRWILAVILFGLAYAQAPEYTVSGKVVYAASYNLGRWEGSNTSVRGTVRWNAQTGEASGKVCVDLDRFDSGNILRDADARGVFDTNQNKESCLEVERLTQTGDEATLSGTLEISGTRRPVRFVGKLTREGNAYRYQGKLNTSFSEWNLKRPSLFFLNINDPIEVRIEARAVPR